MPAAIPFLITFAISTAISIGLKLVASLLTPKPKTQATNLDDRQQGTTVTARQPIGYWRVGYGEVRVGGLPIYMGTTENNDKFHVVAACIAHEIDSFQEYVIGEHWLHPDDLDSTGKTLPGGPLYFSGNSDVRIQTKLGTANQTAFEILVSETAGEWSDAHRARGHALLYVRYNFQPTIFPSGLPNQSAVIRGKKVYDPRDDVTRWTPNAALCIRDFLLTPKALGGYGMTSVDETAFAAAANVCDEFVATAEVSQEVTSVDADDDLLSVDGEYLEFQTGDRVEIATTSALPAGLSAATDYYVIPHRRRASKITTSGAIHSRPSLKLANSYANALAGTAVDITDAGTGVHTITKTGEPRYTINGSYTLDQSPRKVLEELLTSCAGRVPEGAGAMRLMGLAWEAPTLTLDENHLRGPMAVQTKRARRDRFNAVRGTYVSPLNDHQPSDYPAVIGSTYETEDGERIYGDYPQPYTSRAGQAQRVAKVELVRNRFERTVQYPAMLQAYDCKAGEIIAIDNARWNWSGKAFEVLEWAPRLIGGEEGAPYLGLELSLNESDASIFDWASTEEQTPPPVIAPTLPNWRFVPPPTSLYARTTMTDTEASDIVYSAVLSWAMTTGVIVDRGGWFELQTRRSMGSALFFDGIDDFVQLGSSINLAGTGGFTVEGWAYWNDIGASPEIDRGIFANGQLSVFWRESDGLLVAELITTDVTFSIESDAALVDQARFHWAVTWDGVTLSLYIDAVLNDSQSASLSPPDDTSLGSVITPQIGRGKGGSATGFNWSGGADDVRVWSGRIKTAQEIADEKDMGLSGREDGLLHYWAADQEFATQLVDSTISGNHGTIDGAIYEEGALPSQWDSSWTVDGVERSAPMPMLRAAISYDIRIRAFNALGVFSDWAELAGFVVGTTTGATEFDDWGLISDAADSPATDWGGIADSVSETEDWGAVN